MNLWEIFSYIYYWPLLLCLACITRNVLRMPIVLRTKGREGLVLLMPIAVHRIHGKEPSAQDAQHTLAALVAESKLKKEDPVQPILIAAEDWEQLEDNLAQLMPIALQLLEAWIQEVKAMARAIAKIYQYPKREMLQDLRLGQKKPKSKTRKKPHLDYSQQKNKPFPSWKQFALFYLYL